MKKLVTIILAVFLTGCLNTHSGPPKKCRCLSDYGRSIQKPVIIRFAEKKRKQLDLLRESKDMLKDKTIIEWPRPKLRKRETLPEEKKEEIPQSKSKPL